MKKQKFWCMVISNHDAEDYIEAARECVASIHSHKTILVRVSDENMTPIGVVVVDEDGKAKRWERQS